jgi:multiple sugar transport system permease protein
MTRRRLAYYRRSIMYWVLLLPIVAVTLFPFAVMVSTALKPANEIFSYPPHWIPSRLAWNNFIGMWTESQFGQALINSIYVSILSVLLTLAIGVPSAYALFRFKTRGLGGFRVYLLITQMVSPIVLVIGLFRVFAVLGWVDARAPLIITYGAFNAAFTILMLHIYFMTIPQELEEAAWIDGATRLRTIGSVFLPLATPAVAVTALFTLLNVWNEFVIALTLLRSSSNYTLPLKVFALASNLYEVDWNYTMAAVLLATVPAAIVFFWVQRYLISGMASGAIK